MVYKGTMSGVFQEERLGLVVSLGSGERSVSRDGIVRV